MGLDPKDGLQRLIQRIVQVDNSGLDFDLDCLLVLFLEPLLHAQFRRVLKGACNFYFITPVGIGGGSGLVFIKRSNHLSADGSTLSPLSAD